MKKVYVSLTKKQQDILIQNGCTSTLWSGVEVAQQFDPKKVVRCHFEGNVKIGSFSGEISLGGLPSRSCGLYNSTFIDCEIEGDSFIGSVRGAISNYTIKKGVYISDLSYGFTPKGCSFGNGVEVRCVNEGGGREVPIFNELSAQVAYIVAMYRNKKGSIKALKGLIDSYVDSTIADKGVIESGVVICNCGGIEGVNIGEGAILKGVQSLKNGSINSTQQSNTYVGEGVICSDFILSEGCKVDNGSILSRCFVAENCKIDSGFSAVDSLFFANCDVANGEACSIFAGPYTVSHHKSSLLIAGIFSFFNGGSGTNQSNHLLKMGAVHQGVHERGCKFASNGYVALPAREGAFTLILGRHYNHHDTQNLPYSYLVEQNGESYLVPAINLKSFGTLRDLEKWPKRDFRIGEKRDLIVYNRYNPFVGQKLITAIKTIKKLMQSTDNEVLYCGVKIKKHHLESALTLYTDELMATLSFLLQNREEYATTTIDAPSKWSDIAGFIAPMDAIDVFLYNLERGFFKCIKEINQNFNMLYKSYPIYALKWCDSVIKVLQNERVIPSDINQIVESGKLAMARLNSFAKSDGDKDKEGYAMVSYGIDDAEGVLADFNAVRNL